MASPALTETFPLLEAAQGPTPSREEKVSGTVSPWLPAPGGPNIGVQATANSLRSCLAPAIGGA